MVTKKTAKNGDAGSEEKTAKVADGAPEGEPELPYRLGTWHGMTQYRCPQCPFDALEETTILEHIAGHFVAEALAASAADLQAAQEAQEQAAGSGLVLVADKNGNRR